MIRTVSFVLGVLIAASSAYYIVFWGYFNVDVFQYIQPADIIKGIAYPIKESYSWLSFLAIEFVAATLYALYSSGREENLSQPRAVAYYSRAIKFLFYATVSAFSLAVVCGIIGIDIVREKFYLQYAVSLSNLAIPLIVSTIILACLMLEAKDKLTRLKNNEPYEAQGELVKVLDLILIAFASYFFVAEISYGMINSRKIEARMSYDYVLANKILAKDGVGMNDTLIYLGAISDRYVFLKRDKPAYFIIDKYHLPVLLVNHDSKKNRDLSILDESLRKAKKHTIIIYVVYIIGLLFGLIVLYKLFILVLENIIGRSIIKNYNEIAKEDRVDEIRKRINKWLKKKIALRKRKLREQSVR